MILVTGAWGYVGSHALRRLVQGGKKVRALVRDRARAEREGRLRDLQLEWAEGDVTRPESLGPALQGIDTVVHTPSEESRAVIGEWAPGTRAEEIIVSASILALKPGG